MYFLHENSSLSAAAPWGRCGFRSSDYSRFRDKKKQLIVISPAWRIRINLSVHKNDTSV